MATRILLTTRQHCHRQLSVCQHRPSVLYAPVRWVTTLEQQNKQQQQQEERRVLRYGNWLDRLPSKVAPYAFLARIDKPIGTWLLYWPCGKPIYLALTYICWAPPLTLYIH